MKKDILIIFTAILLVAVLITGTNFQSVDEYYLAHIDDITEDSQTVTLSIRCDSVFENYDKLDGDLKSSGHIPADGVILKPTEYVLRSNDTAFDVLCRAVRSNKIQFEYQGSDENAFGGVYVQGINYIYEFSCGSQSGWIYTVNGEQPDYGCSKYKLKDGDCVDWIYTCNLGSEPGGKK